MKHRLIILTILIIAICLSIFVGCKDKPMTMSEYYDIEDFVGLKNFTVASSLETSSCKYVRDDNKILFESDSLSPEYGKNTVYYMFSTQENKAYIGNQWQMIATDDVDDYLTSIEDRTGLVYTHIQSTFANMTKDKFYTIDNEHFFKELFRQKYELYFGNDYSESDFINEFEKQKQELFGDIDKYVVTLDCTKKHTMVLTIDYKSEEPKKTTFTYTEIDNTEIILPE